MTVHDKEVKETFFSKIKDLGVGLIVFFVLGPPILLFLLGFLGFSPDDVYKFPDWFGVWFMMDLSVMGWGMFYLGVVESVVHFKKVARIKSFDNERIIFPICSLGIACYFSWLAIKEFIEVYK